MQRPRTVHAVLHGVVLHADLPPQFPHLSFLTITRAVHECQSPPFRQTGADALLSGCRQATHSPMRIDARVFFRSGRRGWSPWVPAVMLEGAGERVIIPASSGHYEFRRADTHVVVYIGRAKGQKGLRQRLLQHAKGRGSPNVRAAWGTLEVRWRVSRRPDWREAHEMREFARRNGGQLPEFNKKREAKALHDESRTLLGWIGYGLRRHCCRCGNAAPEANGAVERALPV